MVPSVCEIDGNADFYGIGVRLGLYAQSLSTLLVTLFVPEEEPLYRILNLLLQLAIMSGLVMLTKANELYAFEAVIAFWLLAGALSSLTGDGISAVGSISGTCRILFYAALSAYGCWFWFGGLDGMQVTPCKQIVFFGETSLDSGFQAFGKFIAILGLATATGMMLWTAARYINHPRRSKEQQLRRPRTEITLLILSISILCLSIASTEYVVHANHLRAVGNVSTAGQALAFIIGLFGLINTLLSILKEGRLGMSRCWLLFGRHLT